MGPRPAQLDLQRSKDYYREHQQNDNDDDLRPPPSRTNNFHLDLPSPRAGEIPPALSPLDAFALQSRMLAQRFENEARNGRRLSRLPHTDVAQEFGSRPGFLRNASGESNASGFGPELPRVQEETSSPTKPPTSSVGLAVTGLEEKSRPISQYPLFGHARQPSGRSHPAGTPFFDAMEEQDEPAEHDYFGISMPRSASPEPTDTQMRRFPPSPLVPSLTNSIDSLTSTSHPRTATNGSAHSQRSLQSERGGMGNLALPTPRSPARNLRSANSATSIRSVRQDSGDDEQTAYPSATLHANSAFSSSRKFSGGSNLSRPHSPYSPYITYTPDTVHRSPSLTSNSSIGGHQQPLPQQQREYRPPVNNFSRPSRRSSDVRRPSAENRRPSHTHAHDRPPLDHQRSNTSMNGPPSSHVSDASSVTYHSRQNSTTHDDLRTSLEEYTALAANPFTSSNEHHLDTPLAHNDGERNANNDEYFAAAPAPATPEIDGDRPATSYTYAKYALPRGRHVERESVGDRSSWFPSHFSWGNNGRMSKEQAQFQVQKQSQPSTKIEEEPRSQPDPARPWQSIREVNDSNASLNDSGTDVNPRHILAQHDDRRAPSPAGSDRISGARLSRRPSNRSLAAPEIPTIRSRSAGPRATERRPENSSPRPVHRKSPSVQTESTNSTIKAIPLHQRVPSASLSPEEHLEVGIKAHDAGQLSKSTYHLRVAALAGLPTAQLLYALACRHGWGMRSNPEEGVAWLKKAIDGVGLEVVDFDALPGAPTSAPISTSSPARSPDPSASASEKKKRQAQFGLAIYELGMSYMNGWGCAKDKSLAVRCFEVAGNWGDCDALAEAGYCYTRGVGVKKDLKKAAKLYRRAADGGMGMAGNSWIYKAKYMDEDDGPHVATNARNFSDEKKERGRRTDTFRAVAHPEGDGGKAAVEAGSASAAPPPPTTRPRGRSLWGRKKEKA